MSDPSQRSANREPPPPQKRSGVWIIINLLLVGAAAYILYKREHPSGGGQLESSQPVTVSTPAPVASPAAMAMPISKPLPAASAPPRAPATPEPAVMLSSVDRRALPRQVILTKPVDFILLSDGKQVGSVHAAAGVRVDLVDVASDNEIEVQMGGVRQTIPASDTDIENRVRALLKYR